MPEPTLVVPPPHGLRRVARLADALKFPAPAAPATEDSGPLHGRRRFDDLRGEFGVLYCASSDEAAFGDDISPHRPRVVAGKSVTQWISDFFGTGPDPNEPVPGRLPSSYFDDRVIVNLAVEEGARFVDVDDPMTHAALDDGLAGIRAEHGLAAFDRSVVMGSDRRITGAIARYFYSLSQRPGYGSVIGLRYQSRFARDWERWAVWNPDGIYVAAEEAGRPVTRDDLSLRAAAERLGVVIPTT